MSPEVHSAWQMRTTPVVADARVDAQESKSCTYQEEGGVPLVRVMKIMGVLFHFLSCVPCAQENALLSGR